MNLKKRKPFNPEVDKGWFEDYSCGCVSEIVQFKRELPGYCGTHGNNRRQVWPVNHPAMMAEPKP